MADYRRLRKTMEDQGLDALLILGNRNAAYLAGGIGDGPWTNEPHGLAPWIVCIAPQGKSFTIGATGFREIDMPIESIEADQTRDARLLLAAKRIRAVGLSEARIGMDMDYMAFSDMAKLTALLPKCTFESADILMTKARAAKTPAELEWMSKSMRASEAGFKEVLKRASPGMPFTVLSKIWAKTVLDMGSLPVCGTPTNFLFNTAGRQTKGDALLLRSPAVVEESLIYRFDFGAVTGGYFSDQKFNFCVGTPSAGQMAVWNEHRDRQIFIEDFVRPGMTKREVYEACQKSFRHVDEYDWWIHGVGLEKHEEPHIGSLSPHSIEVKPEVTFELNNVSSLESSWLMEDLYILKAGGFKRLGALPQEVTFV